MPVNTVPHPPNAAWMPPIDPNDEEALQQEQILIEQQFKAILSHDIVNAMGSIELREQDEQEEEDDQADDLQEYGDQIQIPVTINSLRVRKKYDLNIVSLITINYSKHLFFLCYNITC